MHNKQRSEERQDEQCKEEEQQQLSPPAYEQQGPAKMDWLPLDITKDTPAPVIGNNS